MRNNTPITEGAAKSIIQNRKRRSTLSPELQAMADIEQAYAKQEQAITKARKRFEEADKLASITCEILIDSIIAGLDDASKERIGKWILSRYSVVQEV